MRSKIATAVAAALPLTSAEKDALQYRSITGYNEAETAARRVTSRNGEVRTGIDVLEAHGFDLIQGTAGKKKIGLLTNQTGVDSQGRRTIDVLAQAPGVSLDAIFSPEHGVTGSLDTTDIGNSKDAATGVPVYSVYGGTDAARRPSLDVLKTLDAVVVDIQDAGVRFYTYETTLGYFLEGAAKAGIEIIVLDRPNPITGSFVQGPIADPGHESFTNYDSLPVRHGMTIGELAKMFNGERGINARLQVVPLEGWMRGDWYDSTGLAWVNPSPNLRSLTEATLYPGVALVEGTRCFGGTRHRYSVRIARRALDQWRRVGSISECAGYFWSAVRADEFYSDRQLRMRAEVSRGEHYSGGPQWVRRARTRSGTGISAAQAVFRAISHGANGRSAGESGSVRRNCERRRPTTDCGRLARAAGEVYAGSAEISALQISHSGVALCLDGGVRIYMCRD